MHTPTASRLVRYRHRAWPVAAELLPRVFIHELQHKINHKQHSLVSHGDAEDTWLNEALSMFAQELGGWQVPDPRCAGSRRIPWLATPPTELVKSAALSLEAQGSTC